MDQQSAQELAERFLDEFVRPQYEDTIVIATCTEFPDHWVFGYQTRAFIESNDPRRSLLGKGPVVVPKSGDTLWLALSGSPVSGQLTA
jgi:hypothetical protein